MDYKKKVIIEEIAVPVFFMVFYLTAYFLMRNDPYRFPHAIQDLSCVALSLICPFFFFVCRFRIAAFAKYLYFIFVFLAMFLANAYNFYQYIPNWDKYLHFLSGPLVTLLGLYILVIFRKDDLMSTIEALLFAFLFCMTTGIFWEFIELFVDLFLMNNAQHYVETGVMDTMTDCLAMASGSALTLAFFNFDAWLNNGRLLERMLKHLHVYDAYNNRKYKDKKDFFRKPPESSVKEAR